VADEDLKAFIAVAERLEKKIDTIAEGVLAANVRLDQFRSDVASEFNDVRSMIKFSHHELDRRVRTLEDTVANLQARVQRLESAVH
jgi:hypothetical protein